MQQFGIHHLYFEQWTFGNDTQHQMIGKWKLLSLLLFTGMPFNQLGTLAGSKFYNVEATYYYLRWWGIFTYSDITLHPHPSKLRVLTNISPLLASNQRPPLRVPMATWSACLTKLPRCTTRWRSRRWRSCLRLDKGEEGTQDVRGTENFHSGKIWRDRSRSHNCWSVPVHTV